MKSKVDKCPHCGSDYGYDFVYFVEYVQTHNWDDEPISAEQTGNGIERKRKVCAECNKPVNNCFFKEV